MPIVMQQRIADQTRGPNAYLLKDALVVGNGLWLLLDGLRPFTLSVRETTGGGTFTVRIFVSDEPDQPGAADTNHPTLTADITTPAASSFDLSYRWIMARLQTVAGGASIRCAILAG